MKRHQIWFMGINSQNKTIASEYRILVIVVETNIRINNIIGRNS